MVIVMTVAGWGQSLPPVTKAGEIKNADEVWKTFERWLQAYAVSDLPGSIE